ncbi:hypothetical protein DYU05_18950 [Mucilaginibacter terrenus]|uniref:Uncharacterized protein n=1 Tax=Mucilaginibacter terrenus TaxID=2482727 RepID=A0A3E2NKA7_9SPHI|nr:hypothetical protein [Mucilaginibacter terrenus]RFZ81363.1 hypothetical protein DYU05_18950 [Mucilaginibacter terrenus]
MDIKGYLTRLKLTTDSSEVSDVENNLATIKSAIDINSLHDQSAAMIYQLFKEYDGYLIYLRFGDYQFYDKIEDKKGTNVFAGSSGSQIAFTAPEAEVIEYDLDEWSILDYCAQNTTSFLLALLPVIKFLKLEIKERSLMKKKELLESAIVAAGGKRYKRFYEQFFGDWL